MAISCCRHTIPTSIPSPISDQLRLARLCANRLPPHPSLPWARARWGCLPGDDNFLSPWLKKGTILACFHFSGKAPDTAENWPFFRAGWDNLFCAIYYNTGANIIEPACFIGVIMFSAAQKAASDTNRSMAAEGIFEWWGGGGQCSGHGGSGHFWTSPDGRKSQYLQFAYYKLQIAYLLVTSILMAFSEASLARILFSMNFIHIPIFVWPSCQNWMMNELSVMKMWMPLYVNATRK